MKPQFDTDFEYDEWSSKMREHQVIDDYFLDKIGDDEDGFLC